MLGWVITHIRQQDCKLRNWILDWVSGDILGVSYDTEKHIFCIIVLYLESNLCLQKLLYAVNNFMCKNPTAGEKGVQGLFFIAFINKAGLLKIGHSVLQCLYLVGAQTEGAGKSHVSSQTCSSPVKMLW